MPNHRHRRGILGQGGFTLIELLIAMSISLALLSMVVRSLGQAGTDQRDVERRSQALINGQIGLERMTRELRQATWVYFRSSSVVDINVRVRAAAAGSGVFRLVRHDCSGETCLRSEGPATIYPPPASPSFDVTQILLGASESDNGARSGQILGHDIFRPLRVDPATGTRTVDFLAPDFMQVRLRLSVPGRERVLELEDGVNLRNRTQFAGT